MKTKVKLAMQKRTVARMKKTGGSQRRLVVVVPMMLTMTALLVFVSTVEAFVQSPGRRMFCFCPSVGSISLGAARRNPEFPRNEFSRTLDPVRLKTKRDYHMHVKATAEECKALAGRFELSDLSALEADLVLRGDRMSMGIQVEGTVMATVTQRCVRTCEDFVVHVEFPLYSMVRPVMPLSSLSSEDNLYNDNVYQKESKKKSVRPQDRDLDDMDVLELQRMLQADLDVEDDVLMEDESIFPIGGRLDVGELVSQLFWLQLDPYPKKPGTSPMRRSITG
jgi:hypothetical protein